MTLDWDLAFPFVYNKPVLAKSSASAAERNYTHKGPHAQEMAGKVGVAPLPGASHVYDRSSASIVRCNAVTCPLSTPHPVAQYSVVGAPAPPLAQQQQQQQNASMPQNASTQLGPEWGTWEAAGVFFLCWALCPMCMKSSRLQGRGAAEPPGAFYVLPRGREGNAGRNQGRPGRKFELHASSKAADFSIEHELIKFSLVYSTVVQ